MKGTPTSSAYLLLAPIITVVLVVSAASVAVAALTGEFDQRFNLAEGIFWATVAGTVFWRTRRSAQLRKLGAGTALTFAAFGLSDFIEVKTRAWYTPWWLFALKAACVASLIAHFAAYLRQRAATTGKPRET